MKRSAQIALVVMAATGVGATSYALMPRKDCGQAQLGATQDDACRGARGGTSHGGSGFYGSSRTSSGSSSGSTSASFFGGTARGGFGGTAHGMGAHGSGT
jgi:hypothetical protein